MTATKQMIGSRNKIPDGTPVHWRFGKGSSKGYYVPVKAEKWNVKMERLGFDSIVRKSLELVMNNHFFKFGDEYRKQVAGPPMGVRFSPIFCCMFLVYWEEELEKKKFQELSKLTAEMWKRYVDDVFSVWTKSEREFKNFIEKINKIHPNIKFTAEDDSKGPLQVLDLELSLEDSIKFPGKKSIVYKHYRKPTAANNIIDWRSAGGEKEKISIVSSMMLQILKNCKYEKDAEEHLQQCLVRAREKHWPEKTILQTYDLAIKRWKGILKQIENGERSRHRSREERKQYKTNNTKILPVAIFLEPMSNKRLFNEIKHECEKFNESIKDHLEVRTTVREKFGTKSLDCLATIDYKPRKCTDSKCSICTSTIFEGEEKHPDCQKCNAVYMIRCNLCGWNHYVGETDRMLKTRFKEHNIPLKTEEDIINAFHPKQWLRNEKDTNKRRLEHAPSAVAAHCMECHNGNFELSIKVLKYCQNEAERKLYEAHAVEIYEPSINRRIEGNGIKKLM